LGHLKAKNQIKLPLSEARIEESIRLFIGFSQLAYGYAKKKVNLIFP